jgi:hypothetical protein
MNYFDAMHGNDNKSWRDDEKRLFHDEQSFFWKISPGSVATEESTKTIKKLFERAGQHQDSKSAIHFAWLISSIHERLDSHTDLDAAQVAEEFPMKGSSSLELALNELLRTIVSRASERSDLELYDALRHRFGHGDDKKSAKNANGAENDAENDAESWKSMWDFTNRVSAFCSQLPKYEDEVELKEEGDKKSEGRRRRRSTARISPFSPTSQSTAHLRTNTLKNSKWGIARCVRLFRCFNRHPC